jgi:isocitrate/isopropylmalate dehydrogenase
MAKKKVLLIPGDGIGKEVVSAAALVLAHFDDKLCISQAEGGFEYWQRTGRSLPCDAERLVEDADGVLFGATGTPYQPPPGYDSPILRLRKLVGGCANLRFCANPLTGVDILIVRECTEGMYSAEESEDHDGAISIVRTSITATKAVAEQAWAYAQSRQAPVTIVHKANVLRVSDGLFRRVAIETIESLGGVKWNEEFVDAAAYHMIKDPKKYSVMLMNSANGDILSDIGAAVCGGLGFVPSLLSGPRCVLAEPIHGSAPDIAGKNVADPTGTLLSAAKLLAAIGLDAQAARLNAAVESHWSAYPSRCIPTDCVARDVLSHLEQR